MAAYNWVYLEPMYGFTTRSAQSCTLLYHYSGYAYREVECNQEAPYRELFPVVSKQVRFPSFGDMRSSSSIEGMERHETRRIPVIQAALRCKKESIDEFASPNF